MDRISGLPQDILHHIYSFLPTKDLVKTSLLSTYWHSVFVLYPNLDFDRENRSSDDLKFINHVNESILRSHKHKLDIKQFRLNLNWREQWETTTVYQSVREVLGFFRNIRVLELRDCVLKWCLPVNLPCLIKLRLDQVESDEFSFKRLLEGCPQVSDFSCFIRYGLKSLSISGLKKLKILTLVISRIEITVAIDAPILESLHIGGGTSGDVELVRGQSLKSVVLEYGYKFNGEIIEDLVSKSPLLESLTLSHLCSLDRLNIASPHLKNLKIVSCENLGDCNVNAPNLHTFRGIHPTNHLRGICFVPSVRCWWRIELNLFDRVHQLADLKKFLRGKKIKYLVLSVRKGFVKYKEVAKFSRCCEVEHLSLEVSYSEFGSFEKTVQWLVSVCQPKELNVFKSC